MKNLVLVRIDDRLIHGQVVTQWMKDAHANKVLIIDDGLPDDALMKRVLKAAAPPGVKVIIKSIADSIPYIQGDPKTDDEAILVLVKFPAVIEALLDAGITIPKVILGGMGIRGDRKVFNRNVAANEEEIACMKRIVAKGSALVYQLVPSDAPVDVQTYF
ncbi:PTS mannose/fructose/sorbose transporter subunit IIB [Coriobacteriales bacterium OH1046]|nr:PTS mannose/fructose/sorbose transporter subunit IIB [Coriobacteriales bacterium OH1046]